MICGIDPGFSGALSWYDEIKERLVWCAAMPLTTNSAKVLSSETRVEVDLIALSNLLRQSRPTLSVVERVNASPQMGVTSAFRFGEGFGGIMGVLAAFEIQTRLVYPNAWKAGYALSADKAESTRLACKLFPEWSNTFLRGKKSADLAESALLAYYGVRFLPTTAETIKK